MTIASNKNTPEPAQTSSQSNSQERRLLLIDATMTAIADVGLSKVTLAKIASIAGLTAGTVNFYFDSKEALLLSTLKAIADKLDQTITTALAEAGSDPAEQLAALLVATLDPDVTEHRKMAVWHAFASEGQARDDYQRICGGRDRNTFNIIHGLCRQIIALGDRPEAMNARAMANAIQGLIDEVWQEILFTGEHYDRADAAYICFAFLASVFPWCYNMPREPGANSDSGEQAVTTSFTVRQASARNLEAVARLFDDYRQFYQQAADLANARRYLAKQFQQQSSVIYIACDNNGKALGFTQLYPSFCSVDTADIWILYDLFVSEEARQLGVAKALMDSARQLALETGASRIDLETAVDNQSAQALYESLGYRRDTEYYKYSLELKHH